MGPGSHIKKLFAGMLVSASPQCLCHPRARLMDIWGVRLCRTNIESIVDWLEEEADTRNLVENPEFITRMVKYVTRVIGRKYRFLRHFPRIRGWLAKRMLATSGKSRRVLLKRMVLLCIERAKRGKPT